ncbi:urease accessory protein UreF [Novosphingobium sp. PY1]|uniref:Urease accessory protein UreF n=2 Tax=Alphaproteobacteria TaxID=28211 RepID=A0A292GRZ0_9HYPH|nr:urease accessory protein UreF [Ochrobactrum sp. PW1]GFM29209.1 urease accessory protein UreF [Novosphingobium sp. PY1]
MSMAKRTITLTATDKSITPMADAELFDLMSWMSPAWPIGAFAHSSGLEWAVEAGHVTDRSSTRDWIVALVEHGAIHNDLVLFTHAWRASRLGDAGRFDEVAQLALASQIGHERYVESTAQGSAFVRISRAASGVADFTKQLAGLERTDIAYPVAAAALFALRGIALERALTAWLHGAVSNLVSAAQRLVPLGQTDGQLVLHDCREVVMAAVKHMASLPDGDPFDALGGCTLVADLGCMAHETQYTRLFRT